MKNKNLIFLFISLFILTGCSIYHVDSQNMTDNFYPSKNSPSDIEYLETVNQPHEVIGIAIVNTERRQTMDDVIEKMKYEAAILGGDAITDIKTDASGGWKKLPAQKFIGNAYVRANFSASIVVFK